MFQKQFLELLVLVPPSEDLESSHSHPHDGKKKNKGEKNKFKDFLDASETEVPGQTTIPKSG